MSAKRNVSVADAKRGFSDLLGRVAYGRETIVITRRGRPMAKLVPVETIEVDQSAASASRRGWLEDDDPFFQIIDQIVSERPRHKPRVLAAARRRRASRGRRR